MATNYPVVNSQTLPSIIEQEVAKAVGHMDGELSSARARELEYYYGRPFGNEVEGESQVVSTDVGDAVEGILPIILSIFTSSDDVVRFEPNGPEDEDMAKQQTEVANYVFYRQNNGFLVLYEWFKDALIQKNGIVKYWWEDKQTDSEESYKDLTDGEYQKLMSDYQSEYMEVEVLEHKQEDDESAVAQRDQMVEQIKAAAAQTGADPSMVIQQLMAQPLPQTHDLKVKITKDVSKICIQAIPPEEFGISAKHNCISIQDAPFCYHRSKKSISELREMGCPESIIKDLQPASSEPDQQPEAFARDRYLDDSRRSADDKNVTETWVTECYIRLDCDGDGIAELRHIIMPGRTIWINEKCDHICFAAITPIIMPHRWIGRSLSELVMDIQFTKSVIWRQMLNNLYLTNNPRKAVLSSAGGIVQANLDDLLTSRPGGIMREYVPNAIRNEETPFVAAASFPMLEYMDGVKENRTGVTRYNQGTDADSLNKTARGIAMIQAAGQQRPNLIARIFAETGVKDLMRGIVYMLSKYSSKAMTIKLRNQWVNVDPREWKTQFNMTVNVGLGTGNKDVQLQHLMAIHQQQLELMQTGRGYMVSDENIYNLYTKLAEGMGFKHPELFVTDPQRVPPQAKQRPPDPAIVKAQMDAQEGAAKLQQADKKTLIDAQIQEKLAQINAQTQMAIAQLDAQTKMNLEQMKIEAAARLAVFEKTGEKEDANLEREKAAADIILEREKAAAQIQLEREKAAAQIELDRQKAAADLELQRAQAEVDMHLNSQKTAADVQGKQSKMEIDRQKAAADLQVKDKMLKAAAPDMTQVADILNTSVELQKQMLDTLSKPKTTSIKDLVIGKDGKVTGATITSKPNG